MGKRLALNVLATALAIFLAVLFYIKSLNLPRAAYELPRILSYLITFLALALSVEAYFKYRKEKTRGEEEAPQDIKYLRAVLFVLAIIGYVLAIQKIGYFIVTPLFIMGTMIFLKATRPLNVLLISAGFTLFVYFLFVKFLHLPIPLGPLS